jgi:hypothetical protein
MWKTIFLISEEDFSDTMMLKNEEKFVIAIQYRYICAFVSSQKENNNVLVIESFLSAIHSIIEKILLLPCKHSHSII